MEKSPDSTYFLKAFSLSSFLIIRNFLWMPLWTFMYNFLTLRYLFCSSSGEQFSESLLNILSLSQSTAIKTLPLLVKFGFEDSEFPYAWTGWWMGVPASLSGVSLSFARLILGIFLPLTVGEIYGLFVISIDILSL